MSDTIYYTQDEIALKSLVGYYRSLALHIVLSGAISALPDVISKVDLTNPEVAKILSDKLSDTILKQVEKKYYELLVEDEKISEALKDELRKAFNKDIDFKI